MHRIPQRQLERHPYRTLFSLALFLSLLPRLGGLLCRWLPPCWFEERDRCGRSLLSCGGFFFEEVSRAFTCLPRQ